MGRTSASSVQPVNGGVLALGAGLASCVASATLVPLAPNEEGVVVVERAGIVLSAEVKPGLQQVPPDVTPIRISIENRADHGIYVDVTNIELSSPERTFEAVPAEEIRPPRPIGLSTDPASPYASAQGAAALQYGTPGGVGAFGVDRGLAYGSGDGWRSPTSRELVMSAFDGGFIDIGERQSGLVFFETPPEVRGRLTLRVRVHQGSGSAPLEILEIPYAYSLEG